MNDIKTTIMLQRCVNYEDKGLVIKTTIDSDMIVVDRNGKEVPPVVHNGQQYIPCNIGDTIIAHYSKQKYSRNFKVTGIERSGQFYICEIIYSMEENIELQLIELKNQVDAGALSTNKAHLKADDLVVSLLYNKGLDRVADAFVSVPKYYE